MKKIFSLAAFAFCIAFSVASRGQSIILLADNVQGSSLVGKGAIDVISMGTGLECGNCSVTPFYGGAGAGKIIPNKIVFNMLNDAAVNTLKNALFVGNLSRTGGNGDAYFVYARPGGTVGGKANYYYIKLSNYTVLEIVEASDKDSHSIQVSLGFSALTWTTKTATGGTTSYGWDFSKNIMLQGTAIPTGY